MLEDKINELDLLEKRFQKINNYENLLFYKKIKNIQNIIVNESTSFNLFLNSIDSILSIYEYQYKIKANHNNIEINDASSNTFISYFFKSKEFKVHSHLSNDISKFIHITSAFYESVKKHEIIFDNFFNIIFEKLTDVYNFLHYKENEEKIKKITYLKKYLKLNFKKYKKDNPINPDMHQSIYKFVYTKNKFYFHTVYSSGDTQIHALNDNSYIIINTLLVDNNFLPTLNSLDFLKPLESNFIDLDLFYDFVSLKNKVNDF